jgi:DNA-binding MarR family transcriptional regulator
MPTVRAPVSPYEAVAASCVCLLLRKATRAVSQVFREALRPVGLEPTQFAVLVALHLHGTVTVTELAEVLVTDHTTLSRNLLVLERLGVVAVTAGPDRRTKLVRLTDAGDETLSRAIPIWHEAHERLTRALGERQFAELLQLTDRLTCLAVSFCSG